MLRAFTNFLLQAFIGMLEKIDVPVPTQQDAEDLCYSKYKLYLGQT